MPFNQKYFTLFVLVFPCILLIFILNSCSQLKRKNYSPKDDQYWEELVHQASNSKKSIISILQEKSPDLYRQIQKDSQDQALLSFWGQSLNFDSGANKKILSDQLISDLQGQFGIKNDNMHVHAGVTHTYGYLFSILETPYGFKRKRWILPTLNDAFAFNGNGLSPATTEGGLLSNITYFAGRLAFKHKSDQLALSNLLNVSSEVKNFDYSKLSLDILEEKIIVAEVPLISLRTTFVRLPFKRAGEENDFLLIYSALRLRDNKEVLITAFPIKEEAYKKITATDSLGANKAISVRYNAYLEGLMEQKLSGIRTFSHHFGEELKI